MLINYLDSIHVNKVVFIVRKFFEVLFLSLILCSPTLGRSDSNSWNVIQYVNQSLTYRNETIDTNVLVSKYSLDLIGSDIAKLVSNIKREQFCDSVVDRNNEGLGFILQCENNIKIFVIPSIDNTVEVAMTDCSNYAKCSGVAEFLKNKEEVQKIAFKN